MRALSSPVSSSVAGIFSVVVCHDCTSFLATIDIPFGSVSKKEYSIFQKSQKKIENGRWYLNFFQGKITITFFFIVTSKSKIKNKLSKNEKYCLDIL
jgi:hypothetical protein